MASASPSVSDNRAVNPDTLWEALDKALPGRFPCDFAWECRCSVKGFPGCLSIECFLNRVAIAILDYHQVQETLARGEEITFKGREPVAADPAAFPRKRRKLYDADVTLAIQTLEANGLHRVQ
jgi:hypothetical protein